MVAVVPHSLEDLPQPLIVGNVVTDQVGVAHVRPEVTTPENLPGTYSVCIPGSHTPPLCSVLFSHPGSSQLAAKAKSLLRESSTVPAKLAQQKSVFCPPAGILSWRVRRHKRRT